MKNTRLLKKAAVPVLLGSVFVIAAAFLPVKEKAAKTSYPTLGASVSDLLNTVQNPAFGTLTLHLDYLGNPEEGSVKVAQEKEMTNGNIQLTNIVKQVPERKSYNLNVSKDIRPLTLNKSMLSEYFSRLASKNINIASFDSVLFVPVNSENRVGLYMIPIKKGQKVNLSDEGLFDALLVKPCPPTCPPPPPPTQPGA